METSRRLATQQMLGPMRQAWIDTLRQKVAELLSSTLHYSVLSLSVVEQAQNGKSRFCESRRTLPKTPNVDLLEQIGAGGGNRTRTTLADLRILSLFDWISGL